MKLNTVLILSLFLPGCAFTKTDWLTLLLKLHEHHCGDTFRCNNVTSHLEPSHFVIPVPCCIPCSCRPTCMEHNNCCPAMKNLELDDRNQTEDSKSSAQIGTQANVAALEMQNNTLFDGYVAVKSCANIETSGSLSGFAEDGRQNYTREQSTTPLNDGDDYKQTSTIMQDMGVIGPVCVRPQIFYGINKILNAKSYVMIASCPEGFPDSAIVENCNAGMKATNILDIIPVTSKQTGLTYANKYCLLCNGLDISDVNSVSEWHAEIVFFAVYFVNLFNPNLTSVINNLKMSRSGFSNLQFVPSKNDIAIQCTAYDVTSCNQTGLWEKHDETIEKACNCGFSLPIIHEVNNEVLMFKNIACVHCNIGATFNETQLSCGYYEEPSNPLLRKYSLKLNVGSIAPDVVEGTKSLSHHYLDADVLRNLKSNGCPPGHADLMGRCRTVICPRDHYLRDNQCIPLYDVLTELYLNMNLKIMPIQEVPEEISSEFVDKLWKLVNGTIKNVASLRLLEVSLWHLPKSHQNHKEYYHFQVFLFNTTGKIKYDVSILEIKRVFNNLRSRGLVELSNGTVIGITVEFNHGVTKYGRALRDISAKGSGKLYPLMGKNWNYRDPGPHMTISNVNWCYRTGFDEIQMMTPIMFEIKPANIIVYNEQFDIEQTGIFSAVIYICIDLLFNQTNVKQNTDAKTTKTIEESKDDTAEVSHFSDKIVVIVILSVIGGILLLIIFYKVQNVRTRNANKHAQNVSQSITY